MDKLGKLPLSQTQIKDLTDKYFEADKHQWPDWMGIGYSQNEVRYDYHSSAICYSLIRELKPINCLEVGTSFGHSTLFIIDALLKNELPFHFLGFEMIKDLFDITRKNLVRKFGDREKETGNKHIRIINDDVITTEYPIPNDLDFVFIDTNHEEPSTRWYLENVFPKCKKGALIAIHDLAYQLNDQGECVTKYDLKRASRDLEESIILKDLYNKKELPLEKIYWAYEDGNWESTFWLYKGT